MKKIALLMAALLVASAFGRIGPVSQYGQLQAGKVDNGPGRIYGSCKGVTSGNEVAVQGMSLFWSIAAGSEGADYWKAQYVDGLVENHRIQLIRAPMGVDEAFSADAGYYFRVPLKITPKPLFTNKLTFTIFNLVTKRGFLYGPAQLFRPERQT